MNSRLILPPNIVELKGPLIFLAGPIQGAANWQGEAVDILHRLEPKVFVASPRKDCLDDTFVYAAQVDWETRYLNQAARQGAILFWLARETEHHCHRAYAQTTRFELGEWKSRHEQGGAKLAVGIEEGFSNARYIRRRLAQDCPDISIGDSLEATCKNALALIGTT